MAETLTPICNFGETAKNFKLLGTDGKHYTLEECRGENGTLIMFICNHCPFVQAIQNKLVRDTKELLDYGVKSVGIMSNDPSDYVEDSFDNMKQVAEKLAFPFPYLLDDTQQTAHDYGAVCTPDFFAYDKDLQLQYRGRLDDSGMKHTNDNAKRELFLAMKTIAQSGLPPQEQVASVGCSIKWL